MNDKLQKYKIGDIIQHNEHETFKRKIIDIIIDNFYDETGRSTEIYYQTIIIENNNVPPTPIKESSIDKYYKIISS
jgi:hypothetical protein